MVRRYHLYFVIVEFLNNIQIIVPKLKLSDMTFRILSTFCSLLIFTCFLFGCAKRVEKASDWYEADPMAKKLSLIGPIGILILEYLWKCSCGP